MDRERLFTIAAYGALLNGALYIALVFVAALVTHKMAAAVLAIAAAGLAYLNCAAHLIPNPRFAATISVVAMLCGFGAAVTLLR